MPRDERHGRESETITADHRLGPDYVDVRFTKNGLTFPLTFRLSKDAELKAILPDNPDSLTKEQWAALAKAPDFVRPLFTQARAVFGHWKPGETRVIDVPFPIAPGFSIRMTVSATFLRVASLHSRRAAEFALTGEGNMTAQEVAKQGHAAFIITGTSWTDVETGATLDSVIEGRFTAIKQQLPALQVDFLQEDLVDFSKSRF
jgi:hypothetical protein